MRRACLTSLGWLILGIVSTNGASLPRIRFNRDIRPILSDKCFACHGPDARKRQAELRLDVREDAVKGDHIVPGDAGKSLILKHILSADPDEHMPPAKSKLGELSTTEIDTLRRWIQEGAEYEGHWAFLPVRLQGTQSASIDQIVRAGLLERGLKLQARAEPEVLLRRVSFDLTGLPPSAEDVKEFVAEFQKDPGSAWQKRVTHLLSSPQYGERMAVDWLDVSRYADSYGFQVDRERDVWRWRDWVVKAFNENLPYDQFVTWQLAGDLMPGASDEQILATAFNRLHQQESEGGSVEEEYRVEYVADRIQTVATAFLGLTFECARCHDHKYDPISQKDYYGLFSLFQNIDEAGLYSYFTQSPPTPAMMLMTPAAKGKMAELRSKVAALEKSIEPRPLSTPDLSRGELAHFTFDILDQNKLADALHPSPPPRPENPKDGKDAKEAKEKAPPETAAILRGENKLVPGAFGNAILFTGDDPVDLPLGNFSRHEPFSVSLFLQTPDVKDRAVVFHRSQAWTDAASRGYELLIEDGRLKWSLIHFWPGNAISIRAKESVPLNRWQHVVVTYDGSSRAEGLKIFIDGERAQVEIVKDKLTKTIAGGGHDNVSLGERMRDRGFKGGRIDDFRLFRRDVSSGLADDDAMVTALQKVRGELFGHQDAQEELMVMEELSQPKTAYVLRRGEYDKRGEEVTPMTPTALPPFPDQAPRNRLGFAQWLTAPNHPLMARVTVNRLWNSLFGRGLVKSTEDLGSQGERPMYPELLDYLAARFIQGGWDMKALLREIVSSDVYQQRSNADVRTMTDDPENQWLARGPRHRLPAEMIRDNALAASGLLKLELGGAPVNPYEMTEAFKPATPSQGEGVYRRSLYAQWRRTSPPPAMMAFDAPKRSVCVSRRERTDTPLQALILLNGVQYVEAARVLGERMHREANGDVGRMIENGFLRCLSRYPDGRELQISRELYEEQLAHFRGAPKEAEELLKLGNTLRDRSVPAAEAAAATVLAQALLNHDVCVVKR